MTTNIEIDETDIKNVIKAFQEIVNNIDKEMNETLKDIVSKGETYLDAQYVSRVKDPNISDISTSWKKKGDIFELISSGKDVIYEEFGTGDRGENEQHDVKQNYDLDKYNSGGTITDVSMITDEKILNVLSEHGVTSGKFWYYTPGKGGKVKALQLTNEQKLGRAKYLINHGDEVVITQGVPAGQEMWDTRNYLINKVIPKVIEKRGHEISENFKKSIKK